MSASSSTGLTLRTTLTLAALCVAMAACGGGGGGGGTPPAPPPPSPAPNQPPTAAFAAISDGQLVNVALNLTAQSTDPDTPNSQLTHSWTVALPSGASVPLSGSSVSYTPTVVGNYSITLVSSDGPNVSAPVTDTFTVVATNQPPTAAIASFAPSSPRAGQVITFTGAGTDPEGVTPLTYTWTLTQEPAGNTGAVSPGAGGTATFRPTVNGAYRIRLVTRDGAVNSAPVEQAFSVAVNPTPTAVIAGCPSAAVTAGTTLGFQSTGSSDPDSEPLTFQWSVNTVAGNSGAILPAASSANVTLRPTAPGAYVLSLVANDGLTNSAAATCAFTVNGNPVPNAVIAILTGGASGTPVAGGQLPSSPSIPTVTFRADSTDNDPMTHQWRLVSGGGTLSPQSGASVAFTPPAVGTYVIGLISSDGLNASVEATRTLTVNAPPVASFTVNGQLTTALPTIRAGETVALASTATDPEGQALSVSWQVTPPAGAPAVGEPAIPTTGTSPTLSFPSSAAIPASGTAGYGVRLTVNDGVNPAVVGPVINVPVTAQPGAVACVSASATGRLAQTAGLVVDPAGGRVSTGGGTTAGNSVCFHRTVFESIRSRDSIAQGSFQYFEVTRSVTDDSVAIGIAADSAPLQRSTDGTWPANPANNNQYVVVVGESVTNNRGFGPSDASFDMALGQSTFGIAVDYRDRYPVVYVIGAPNTGRATSQTLGRQCVATFGAPWVAKSQCVVGRFALNTTDPVRLYAYGRTVGGTTPQVTINGGESAAYAFEPLKVREALRSRMLGGDVGLNPQLAPSTPGSGGTVLARATIARADDRHLKTVIILDGGLQFRTSLAVTPPGGATQVRWYGPTGTLIGTGATLTDLTSTATIQAITGSATPAVPANGGTTYRIEAVAETPGGPNVMTDSVSFVVTYSPAADRTFDHDQDGIGYETERLAGTDPGSADTDGNGIVDGLTATAIPGSGPTQLRREAGTSAGGVRTNDEGLSAALTSLISPQCDADPPFGDREVCKKRGMRASAGVPPGPGANSFRYFEVTNRLGGGPNMGAGVVVGAGPGALAAGPSGATRTFDPTLGILDPYCCFVDPTPVGATPTPENATPNSSTFNFVGNVWRRLVQQGGGVSFANSETVGIAIDHRVAGQVNVYYVYNDGTATPAVRGPITLTGFIGDAFPFVFGHPQNDVTVGGAPLGDTGLAMDVNFGLKPFVYDAGGLARLRDRVPGGAAIVPGIGVNQRPLN